MQNARGSTIIEYLIVVAIIGIIAAIAIPSLLRAQVVTVTAPFKEHFGVDLVRYAKPGTEPKTWLDDDQKRIIRPLVEARLAELCSRSGQRKPHVLTLEPATNPYEVSQRLDLLDKERGVIREVEATPEKCGKARDAAAHLGFVPAEATP